ncbi:hypothetical protein GUITHDRAFT_44290, partial [Guillardia theta CCMP2712]
FPTLPGNMNGILIHCLASIVYHFDYLRKELDPSHPLWSCALFRDTGIYEQLKEQVLVLLPTDVPIEMNESSENMMCTVQVPIYRSTGCPPHVTSLVHEKQWMMKTQLLQEKLDQVVAGNEQLEPLHSQQQPEVQQCQGQRLLPEDIRVSDEAGVTEAAWSIWHCGNNLKGLPPLKRMRGKDLTQKSQDKRLTDMK